MARKPSGLPTGLAGPTIRKGEIDYDAQTSAGRDAFRGLRKALTVAIGILVVVGVLIAMRWGVDAGAAFSASLGLPLLVVLVGNEALLRWSHRNTIERGR